MKSKVVKIIIAILVVAIVGAAFYGIMKTKQVVNSVLGGDIEVMEETTDTKDETAKDTTKEAKEEEKAAKKTNEFDETDADIDADADYAYAEDVSDEDVTAFIEFLEEQPDIDESLVEDFFLLYAKDLGYKKDPNGVYMPPLSYESMMETDADRPYAAVKAGLQANLGKKPIDDALAFPFDLTVEQTMEIIKAGSNSTIDFEDEEIEDLRLQLFKAYFENPYLFEAHMRLITEQKIGEDTKLIDHWAAGQNFIKEIDKARKSGKGMNIFLRKVNGVYYTNANYQKYVIALYNLLYPRDTKVQVLLATAGNHYHLIAGDWNSMRQATLADYDENLASLTFTFYLKNGKVGLRFGANIRDKRPEVLNFTSTPKPKKSASVTPTPTPTPTPAPSGGGGGGSNPTPTPAPSNPTPSTTPSSQPETKSPAEDPVFNGNADVGGGKNDDSGPGTWKPDQGNSKSDTVEGSQYQPGTSANTDGTKASEYPTGPAADNTIGGEVPNTAAPENQIGNSEAAKSNDDYVKPDSSGNSNPSTSTPASAGSNNGAMSSAPAVD